MRYLVVLVIVMVAVFFWTRNDIAEMCAVDFNSDECKFASLSPFAYYVGAAIGALPIPLLLTWLGHKHTKALVWVVPALLTPIGILVLVRVARAPQSVAKPESSTPERQLPTTPIELTDAEKCEDLKKLMGAPGVLQQGNTELVTVTAIAFDAACNPTISTRLNVNGSKFSVAGAKAGALKDTCAIFTAPSTPSTLTQVSYEYQNLKGVRFPTVTVARAECQPTAAR